jgi:hypothetical protein
MKMLLLTQPMHSVTMFTVNLKDKLVIEDFFACGMNDVYFHYFNSVFLLESPSKKDIILSTITLNPDTDIQSNIDYYLICPKQQKITEMFFTQTNHKHHITCITGIQNKFDIILGDMGGYVSKLIIEKNGKYSCRSTIEPLRCLQHKVYMMSISMNKEFVFVGNDLGKVCVLKIENLDQVRSIEISSLFVNYYFVQSLNNPSGKNNHGIDVEAQGVPESLKKALTQHPISGTGISDGLFKEIQGAFM